jgi:S-adenosylmethionine synthetase
LAYAIGVADPVSVHVDTRGSNAIDENRIVSLIRDIFPLTPKGIIEYLKLRRPIYRKTAHGGHFGRNDPDFTWESTAKVPDLRKAANLGADAPKPQFVVS